MSPMSNEAEGRMLNVNLHVVSNSIYRLNDFLEEDTEERKSGNSLKRSLNDANRAHLCQHKGKATELQRIFFYRLVESSRKNLMSIDVRPSSFAIEFY